VLDSRGNPTVEVEVRVGSVLERAIVPSGASTGVHEALELRDKGDRYGGKGVLEAVKNVNTRIANKITGLDCRNQREIDETLLELDGTENKSSLGANSMLGASMACARAASMAQGVPLHEHIAQLTNNKDLILPVPAMNVINGGAHAGNDLDIQEYMILPVGAKDFSEAVRICSEIYHQLKKDISEKYGKGAVNVGDEGGFAPPLNDIDEPLRLIMAAVTELGYQNVVKLGLDAAATEFYGEDGYELEGQTYTAGELTDLYGELTRNYPLVSIEDPLAEDDWDGWTELTAKLGGKIQVVGDDLLVTNLKRISHAVTTGACNALLLKVNQIGTLTESIDACRFSNDSNWNVMVSHRSGDTEDPFIADLAVGLGSGQIKTGAPARGERTAKYNQLSRIEESLGDKAVYGRKNLLK